MVTAEELGRRAAERTPWCTVVAGRPDSDGWFALADAERFPADAWYAEMLAGPAKGLRDVGGAYLASYGVDLVARTVAGALIHDGATWPVRPATFRLHRRDEDGWFDGIAVDAVATPWHVDADAPDPARGAFGSDDDLYDAVASGLAAIAAPWFDTVRALAPFGRSGMWGMLADAIGSAALEPVRIDPAAVEPAWERAHRLIDRIAANVPALRARPRRRTIAWSGGDACISMQGTCCLYYKVHDPAADLSPYCSGCPLLPEGQTDPRYRSWLEQEYGATAG